MSFISGIPHPFLNETGTGQQERVLPKLDPDSIKIDNRKMVDILNFLSRFSRQVNYYHQNLTKSDWQKFFAKSTPILVANIHRFDFDLIQGDFQELIELVERGPEPENVHHLFDFIYLELALPLNEWQRNFAPLESSLSLEIDNLIASNLQQPIKRFIGLFNAINHWYCLPKRSFADFESGPWGLEFTDLFTRDDSFRRLGGGPRERILALKGMLEEIFQQFLAVVKILSQSAEGQLEEALVPLQKEFKERHTPHLGLLFTFLRLFEFLQNDLNGLSGKHLKFFYENVLGIKPRKVVPDQAHLVLEIQKNLDQYLLKAGTRFQNGKDKNGNDVFYVLDDETVLDQAQLVSVKSLFVNRQKEAVCSDCALPTSVTNGEERGEDGDAKDPRAEDIQNGQATTSSDPCITCNFVEGVYHAPVANSADGLGEAFADPEKASWATLGAKYSKFYGDEVVLPTTLPQEHPAARIGYVVASPVLLLNEGKRTVTFRIEGEYEPEEDCGLNLLNLDFTNIGKEKWTIYERCITEEVLGIEKNARAYLETKIQNNARFCFEDDRELEAFLNIKLPAEIDSDEPFIFSTTEAKDLVRSYVQDAEPIKMLCITKESVDLVPQLSQEAKDFFAEKLANNYRLCFDNENELLAFLEISISGEDEDTAAFTEKDKGLIIENIAETIEVNISKCITEYGILAILEEIDTTIDPDDFAKDFLEKELREKAKICFSDNEEIAAFLQVKDQRDNPIFNEVAKQKVRANLVTTEPKIIYCLTKDFISSLTLSSKAKDYLKDRLNREERICFSSKEALFAFLTLKDNSNSSVFSQSDITLFKNEVNYGNMDFPQEEKKCINRDLFASLDHKASEYLINYLDKRAQLCFEDDQELDAYLEIKDEAGEGQFSNEQKLRIKANVERSATNKELYCITEELLTGLDTTTSGYLYLIDRLGKEGRICFEDVQQRDAFLFLKDEITGLIILNQNEIQHIQGLTPIEVPAKICITSETLKELDDAASGYLSRELTKKSRVCFPDENALAAFLDVKDNQGLAIFDEQSKKIIEQTITELLEQDSEGKRGEVKVQYISKSTLDKMSLTSTADAFLREKIDRRERIIFDSDAARLAFLEIKDANENPVFKDNDKSEISREIDRLETTDNLCVTQDILQKITFLSDKGRDFLFQQLLRSSRLCFETVNEFEQFLEQKDESGNHIFDAEDRLHIKSTSQANRLYETSEKIFLINFSGAEDWISATNFRNRFIPISDEQGNVIKVNLEIEGEIDDDDPPITFADPEVLLEDFGTHLPLAKIEVNEEVMVRCMGAACPPNCSLERCLEQKDEVQISLYHFLKDYKIKGFCIDVKVCGLRNLVVQNDEALQDVNAPIFPFGTRPSIDSNFYIGSQEVFCKNWQKVWVNINWKDKPENFKDYYLGYGTVTNDEILAREVKDENFKMALSVLQEIAWKKELKAASLGTVNIENPYTIGGCPKPGEEDPMDHRPLFHNTDPLNPLCKPINPFQQRIEVDSYYFDLQPVNKTLEREPITEYLSDTQNGFMRLTLKCEDFRHREYPFVLARQMLAFGKFPEEFVFGAVYQYNEVPVVDGQTFESEIRREGISLFDFFQQIDRACVLAAKGDVCVKVIVNEIKDAISNNLTVGALKTDLRDQISTFISESLTLTVPGDYTSFIDNLNTAINDLTNATAPTGAIYNSVRANLVSLVQNIEADDTTVNTVSRAIVNDFVAFLDGTDDQFAVFRTSIEDAIKDLVPTVEDSDEELDEFTNGLINNAILSSFGLTTDQKNELIGALLDNFETLEEDPDLVAFTENLVSEINSFLGGTLTEGQQADLTITIQPLLEALDLTDDADPAPDLDQFREDLVNTTIHEVLGGLSDSEIEALFNQMRPLVDSFVLTSAQIESMSQRIINAMIAAYTPTLEGEVPNEPAWGDELLASLPGRLTSLLDGLSDEDATEALIDETTSFIVTRTQLEPDDSIRAQLKTFVRTTIIPEVQTLLTSLSNNIQPDGIESIISDIFSEIPLGDDDIICTPNQELALCACGAFIAGSCELDDDTPDGNYIIIRDIQIANSGGDAAAYFATFESEANLQELLIEYCEKILLIQIPNSSQKQLDLAEQLQADPTSINASLLVNQVTLLERQIAQAKQFVTDQMAALPADATTLNNLFLTVQNRLNATDSAQADIQSVANNINNDLTQATPTNLQRLVDQAQSVQDALTATPGTPSGETYQDAAVEIFVSFIESLDDLSEEGAEPVRLRGLLPYMGLDRVTCGLAAFLKQKKKLNAKIRNGTVAIPNEPYTPEIKEISLDYTASACRGEKDFKFIHLYPCEGTNKTIGFTEVLDGQVVSNEGFEETPYLFPHHTDSGSLFLGFENLRPGSNVQLLFQLAEATGDSELVRKEVKWEYLSKDNKWMLLRPQRDVLIDDTKQLTTSGIVKIAVPTNIAKPQLPDVELPADETKITIMPAQYRWLKVSVPENASAFSETVGVFTQAVKVIYQPTETNERDNMVLEPEQIAALAEADSNVKGILQPFASFGGQLPEVGNTFNKRVSERLRHRGRAISAFDYEHLVLENFPKVYRAKCINHSLALPAPQFVKDLDVAPGFINIAVIPDLNQLNLGNPLEPRVPISLLTEIRDYLKKKHSPFVKTKIMNPRYERVNISVRVGFLPGKDVNYYTEKLKEDITNFLAPWLIGDFEKLNFGQNVTRSGLMRFIENRDYIDFVTLLGMVHQDDTCDVKEQKDSAGSTSASEGCNQQIDCPDEYRYCQTRPPDCKIENIYPMTARSILTAGDIQVFNYADKRVASMR